MQPLLSVYSITLCAQINGAEPLRPRSPNLCGPAPPHQISMQRLRFSCSFSLAFYKTSILEPRS